eukprot:TRINITY_DN704_c0_g1_i2.p2 TRINITY_DN704_c0_g1~~TRINITY_DN704_c0_g1_i2.p2  ORF type:complete len:210 (+),score=68.14 TRINITY_DN704_c0_g1_i2:67-696(+)
MRALLLALPAVASACTVDFVNNAATPVTLCVRKNGGTPGDAGKVTIASGKSSSMPCKDNGNNTAWQTYFSLSSWTDCGFDTCAPPLINTGTCQHYPYSMGQGISADNGKWYGSVGFNWDGNGQGFVGNWSDVNYGLQLKCTSYGTKSVSDSCDPSGCTPNKPNYGKPNSGVEECDVDKSITVTLTAGSKAQGGVCCSTCGGCPDCWTGC